MFSEAEPGIPEITMNGREFPTEIEISLIRSKTTARKSTPTALIFDYTLFFVEFDVQLPMIIGLLEEDLEAG